MDSILQSTLVEIWDLLNDEERDLIRKNTTVKSFRRGEYLYRTDDPAEYMMCLQSGYVKLERMGVSKRCQILRMLSPKQIFGFRSYFAGQRHITQAVAMESTSVLFIQMTAVEQVLRKNGSLGMFFLRHLSVTLGDLGRRSVNLSQKHIRGRLADTLIFLVDKYGMDHDGFTVNIYLSREDLAAFSNMTTSNAIRTLSEFVDEGVLLVDGRRIKILDRDKLRKASACG
jgi:CRP-like cAMP-binding protein